MPSKFFLLISAMYPTIIWNIRGVGSESKVNYIKHEVREKTIQILTLLEPKMRGAHLYRFAVSIGFPNFWHGNPLNSHIWIFWKAGVQLNVLDYGKHHVHTEITGSTFSYYHTFVYASTVDAQKRDLWSTLASFNAGTQPWLLGGDFNSITSRLTDKKGGSYKQSNAIKDFNDFIENLHLIDAGFLGDPYTWCNNQQGRARIWLRLDRLLLNPAAHQFFPQCQITHLPRILSDHSPLLIQEANATRPRGPFRFQKHWGQEPDCASLIEQQWVTALGGPPWSIFHRKLSLVKHQLIPWSKDRAKQRQHSLLELERSVTRLEAAAQLDSSAATLSRLADAQQAYSHLLGIEEGILKEKSRVKWLKEGDRNSAFFHACMRDRNCTSKLHLKLEDGSYVEDIALIGTRAVTYFQDIFTRPRTLGDRQRPSIDLFAAVPPVITSAQNEQLIRLPDWPEILAAIKALNPDSAPGPDGYNGHFFLQNLEVLRADITSFILDFFRGATIPASAGATVLTLIPKVPHPTSFGEMRPIGLCNFSYKILSKLLNERLRLVLPGLISHEQAGFVAGRSIHENIALATEMLNNIDKKVKGQNTILKVDIAKAYDTLEWSFLLTALDRFGFHPVWRDMMFRCFSSTWFSIGYLGQRFGFFQPARGLRQGDPLSPSLFIIAQEVFSRNLKDNVATGRISPFLLNKGTGGSIAGPSHLLFADDMLVFLNGTRRSLRSLHALLGSYSAQSGQSANPSKSGFIVPDSSSPRALKSVSEILGFPRKTAPITYLGVPLFKGRPKVAYFDGLLDSIALRLNNWKNRLLSPGGRLVLLKSVLSSMPIYLMSILKLPKLVIKKLNSIFASFLWTGKNGSHIHWVSWRQICLPYEEGGLGVKQLAVMMAALQSKLAWAYIQGDTLWASVLRLKYGHPTEARGKACPRAASHCWKNIQPLLGLIQDNSRWIIGRGDKDFWRDRWLPYTIFPSSHKPPALPLHSVCETVLADFPVVVGTTFRGLSFTHEPDFLVFEKGPSGTFSVKSVYELLRHSKAANSIYKAVWHPVHSLKTSLFLWKAYNQRVGVDISFKKRGISLASRCVCCVSPAEESLDHLLVESELATSLWAYFGRLSGFSTPCVSFPLFLEAWFARASWTSQVGLALISLGGVIPWVIWVTRNDCLYSQKRSSLSSVIARIHSIVTIMVSSVPVRSFPSHRDIRALTALRFPIIDYIPPQGSWVQWQRPVHGIKLNCDGSSLRFSAAGGGVFRDSDGAVWAGFSSNFGRVSSLEAEALAVLEGLTLAHSLHLPLVWLELDSLVLVDCFLKKAPPPWQIAYTFRACLGLLPPSIKISHIHREGNRVADKLAAIGHNVNGLVVFPMDSSPALPQLCSDFLVQDAAGFPVFRP